MLNDLFEPVVSGRVSEINNPTEKFTKINQVNVTGLRFSKVAMSSAFLEQVGIFNNVGVNVG